MLIATTFQIPVKPNVSVPRHGATRFGLKATTCRCLPSGCISSVLGGAAPMSTMKGSRSSLRSPANIEHAGSKLTQSLQICGLGDLSP